MAHLKKVFKFSKQERDNFRFTGKQISREPNSGDVLTSMKDYALSLKPVTI